MSRTAYVSGQYVPLNIAAISIEDRGFQFADSVYEVVSVVAGQMIDADPHLDRLERSLAELEIPMPMSRKAMLVIFTEVMRRNRTKDGFLYIQISRGAAPRDHVFPQHIDPALVVTCRRADFSAFAERARKGVAAKTVADIRWGRCDIKSTALLPNVLAKQAARSTGAFEAVLVDTDGMVTEGSSTNIWMVDDTGTLITRPTSDNILAGVTRARVMKFAEECQIPVKERAFSVNEALAADELLLTSATGCATAITELDGKTIGSGKSGPVTQRLIERYTAFIKAPDRFEAICWQP